ncbi:MAG TPA: dihydrofolate reductase family protein [Cyclobacteriaceae bacterium]
MRKIVYYVASSLDGFISAPNDDISGFVEGGNGVEKYFRDLAEFDTVIMGKNTYEFGYRYGLQPGQVAYPHMTHFIFSTSLTFASQDPRVHIKKIDLEEIRLIREQAGSDIYLCGGGQFAGWLLDNEQIDVLKVKLNPLILGQGARLFGSSQKRCKLELMVSAAYDEGLQIMTYAIRY